MNGFKKVLEFLKSLFLPRKMAQHMNMPFILSLIILMLASCLNIATSNIRMPKDVEKALEFPTLFEEIDDKFKLYASDGKELPQISIVNNTADKKGNIKVGDEEKEVAWPTYYFQSDEDGVYHNVFEKDGKFIEVTVVTCDEMYSTYGTIDKPMSVDHFDLEGYFKQEQKANTEYILYVFTLDTIHYMFGLNQVEDGKSTKAIANNLLFECNDSGEFKYFLPKDESELKVNAYGDFDTTLWTQDAILEDRINFAPTKEYYDQLVSEGLTISYDQYKQMVAKIVPANRHLKNLSNALYGGAYSYTHLMSDNFKFEEINTSFPKFQQGFKTSVIEFNSGLQKTTSLIVSAFITLIFPFFLAGITWIMSKSFYMNKFRQYYAIAALCFGMTTIVALIAGFFVAYTKMAFVLLVIGAVYYIVATFRINTLQKEEDENKNDDPKPKEPIKYSKISDDTTFIG